MIPSYHNFYFETQTIQNVIRNSAIFAEAPMAALNFLVALSLNSLYCKQTKLTKYKSIILGIAGFLTFSTTIYIGILLLIVYKYGFKNTLKNKGFFAFKVCLIIISLIVSIIIVKILLSSKLQTSSGVERSSDYINSFNAWLNHPIIGNGLGAGGNEEISIVNGERIAHYGFSSAFSQALGDGGIYIISLIFLFILRPLASSLKNRKWNHLIFVIIFIYLFWVSYFLTTYLCFSLFIFINVVNLNNERAILIL